MLVVILVFERIEVDEVGGYVGDDGGGFWGFVYDVLV